MKSILLSIAVAAVSLTSFGQVRLEPFYPYSNYTLTFAIGNSRMYGDLDKSISNPVYRASLERNFTPFTSVGAEVLYGALSSEEFKNNWTNGLTMYNQFTAANINGRVSLGQFFHYPSNALWKNLFGLYGRVGFGVMMNNVTNISYKFRNRDAYKITDLNAKYINTDEVILYVPYSVGFNLHLTKMAMFNINYQFNYCLSDYVDGYNFSNPPANNYYQDMYSVLSFGLSFYLGKIHDGEFDEKNLKDKIRQIQN